MQAQEILTLLPAISIQVPDLHHFLLNKKCTRPFPGKIQWEKLPKFTMQLFTKIEYELLLLDRSQDTAQKLWKSQ